MQKNVIIKCKTVRRINRQQMKFQTENTPSEDRTHDLEIIRIVRCQLRYRDLFLVECGREHIRLNIT